MISLRKMTEAEFTKFIAHSVPEYAREKMKAERLTEAEAKKLAEDSFLQLLPQKLHSPDHFFFSVVEAGQSESVGSVWFARRKNGSRVFAYIYDIVLDEQVRGKGYGKKTMELLEIEVKKQGLNEIGLHVFGHNKTAANLYEKCGYRVVSQTMVKDI